jgi:regulator of RNase E activity RraA
MMMEADVPARIGGVKVESGDFVFGDVDGLVVIPKEITTDVIAKAMEKVAAENMTRDELKKGMLLREVYEKYGVL